MEAGTVTRVEWYASAFMSSGVFRDLRLRLCHTPLGELKRGYEDNYGGNTPVLVFRGDFNTSAVKAYQWFGWDLTTPFAYNGVDNVIVEVEWMRRSGGPSMGTYSSYRKGGCAYAVGVVQYKAEVYDYVHYMRLTMDVVGVGPSSLGRVKALYR